MRAGLILLCGLAGVTGCAGLGSQQISYTDYNTLYTPELVQYATPAGEMTTVVRGDPFGPGTPDREAIAAAIPAPGWFQPFRFTTQPGPQTPNNYRLVLVFNPVMPGPGGDQVCRDPQAEQVTARGGGPITAQATFCAGDRWVSQLVGYGPPAQGPNDPQFRQLMAQMMPLLLPARRPDLDSDRDCTGPGC